MKTATITLAVAAMFWLFASPALATPITVNSVDTASQDVLYPHVDVDELGTAGFPIDELISVTERLTTYTPCLVNPDNTSIPNIELTIVNLTTRTFHDLVYVADPATTLTNDDGTVNNELAFNIDNLSGDLNLPLVYEDTPNLLFEPGETWKFVIQDYVGMLPAVALGSVGLVGSSSSRDTLSSGSIIAIPEPASLVLIGVGSVLALLKRRRK